MLKLLNQESLDLKSSITSSIIAASQDNLQTSVKAYLNGKLTSPTFIDQTSTKTLLSSLDDSDGDGYANIIDIFPSDSSEWIDLDRDGIGNNKDTDDDGDGVADTADAFPLDSRNSVDTDKDGIGNASDEDDDNDGVIDEDDAFPLDVAEFLDSDGDGIGNNADTDDDNDGVEDASDAFPTDPVKQRMQTQTGSEIWQILMTTMMASLITLILIQTVRV